MVDNVMRPVVSVLASPTVRGADGLEDVDPPVIFAANHHSHLDTPLLLVTIPPRFRHRMFVGAAADYFFTDRLRSDLSALVMGAIPIERTRVTRRSAEVAARLVDDGWSMLIFPEGGRSPDGWGQEFRGGAAYLSLRCSVPVVPVHIDGTDRILPKGRTLPRPGAVTVTFGSPLRPQEGEDARRFARRIEAAVAALADELASDWFSARLRAARGDTPPLRGPEGVSSWRRAWALGERRGRGPGERVSERPRWPRVS